MEGGPPHAAVVLRVGSQLPVGTQDSRDGTEGYRPTMSTGKRANQSLPHTCPHPLATSSLLSPQGQGREGGPGSRLPSCLPGTGSGAPVGFIHRAGPSGWGGLQLGGQRQNQP